MRKSKSHFRRIVLPTVLFTLSVGFFSIFQNCSAVDFETYDELAKAGIEGELRRVRLDPEQSEHRPNIDLVTILDNSYSMSIILEKTQKAFKNMTGKLKGFNGSVSIYTTTQKDADKPSTESTRHVEYRDTSNSLIQIPYENHEEKVPDLTPYSIVDSTFLTKPHTITRDYLNFRGDMNDEAFDNFTADFVDSIKDIGDNGADREEGLCVLMRAIESKRDKDSYPVYVVATNENDFTSLDSCLKDSRVNFTYAPDDIEADANCQPDDLHCKYTYKMQYNPRQKTKLKYKYRSVSEKLEYELIDPEVKRNITFKWDKYRYYAYYQVKRKRLKVKYEPYIWRDGIKTGKGSLDTKEYASQEGVCSTTTEVACSQAEIDRLNGSLDDGIVPGTCTQTCIPSLSNVKDKRLKNWTVGVCSDEGLSKGRQNCSADHKNSISGSRDHSLYNSCEVECYEGTGDKTIAANDVPNRCPETPEPNCTVADEAQAASYYNSVNASDIKSCTVSCSERIVSGDIAEDTDIDICSGVASDGSGSHSDTCSSGQRQKVATALGLNVTDIATCDHVCNQSQVSGNKNLEDPTTCEVGTVTCADQAHIDLAATEAAGPVTSCDVQCSNKSPRNACRKTITTKDSCETDSAELNALANLCAVQGETLRLNTCELESAVKKEYTVKYVKSGSEPVMKSYVSGEEEEDVAKSVKDLLIDVHGENFFYTSFIYPPGDENCQPPLAPLSAGERYKAVADLLPANNSATYPNCMNDYSPAMEVVFDQIVRTMIRTYSVEMDLSKEWVWSVYVTFDSGQSRKLQKDEYSVRGKILTINEGVDLEGLTKIDVDVVVPK